MTARHFRTWHRRAFSLTELLVVIDPASGVHVIEVKGVELDAIEVAGVALRDAKIDGFRHSTELGVLRLIPDCDLESVQAAGNAAKCPARYRRGKA